MQAPLPASLEGPCAFTASHLEPSDSRATLVPLTQRDPRAWAGPSSGPQSSARWRPPVGCALRWWPPTEALRVPSEPGWSPRACALHVAGQEGSGSPRTRARSATWAIGVPPTPGLAPLGGAGRGPPVACAGAEWGMQ